MKTKIIYYVHGTTFDNASKKCSGWKQIELNEQGKEQAINLGKNTPYKFDVLFTSDLIRAQETAQLAFPKIHAISDERLRECNYGIYDGEEKSKVIYEKHIKEAFPNGESLLDVEKRIREFVDYIKKEYKGKTIGIIAHRAPQLALEVITKNISWEEAIEKDWRKTGNWQPGWEYNLDIKLKDLTEISANVDLDEYLYLYNYVRENMEHPEWLGTFEKPEIEEILNNGGKIWMYHDKDIPVCSVFYIPTTNKSLKKHNVDYDESITGSLGPIMVRKEYIGNGLQSQMQEVINEYVKSIRKQHMFTKAHADNIYSIRNILKDGYKVIDEYENERGRIKAFIKD